jgi:uncharacterized membrane-anchored protein YhcB (DUF1043 family)
MFEMNPHQLPDAVMQHWIMLLGCGIFGFIIGYIWRKTTVRQLENQIVATESQVEDCVNFSQTQQDDIVLQRNLYIPAIG